MNENNISNKRKKQFIVENSLVLNKEIKLIILSIVMMEVGQSVIMETNNSKSVDINLDLLELKNIEVLNHIYNIIKKRVDILNHPAKSNINDLH
jgi:ABC-type transport system involved in Fe-S cluster assembly fused permease/ATPase subunit